MVSESYCSESNVIPVNVALFTDCATLLNTCARGGFSRKFTAVDREFMNVPFSVSPATNVLAIGNAPTGLPV
jgi:hypothetical protein